MAQQNKWYNNLKIKIEEVDKIIKIKNDFVKKKKKCY